MNDQPSTSTLLFSLSILFSACGPWKDEQPPDDAQSTNSATVVRDRASGPLLELDHGERWVVSPPMLVPIQRMQERIAMAVEPGPTATPDHTVLADSLFVDLDALVMGCTMEGKAHEELHDWLMPHMQLVQDLEKSTDTVQARAILKQLAASSAEFDRYFQ
ncbi:MAG: hypothetical protein IPN62_12200 [Flavobacteriales bacterium]|nr:hypothetical protein [Flavobacteriales bacterium]